MFCFFPCSVDVAIFSDVKGVGLYEERSLVFALFSVLVFTVLLKSDVSETNIFLFPSNLANFSSISLCFLVNSSCCAFFSVSNSFCKSLASSLFSFKSFCCSAI
jgi:hypothetical protein